MKVRVIDRILLLFYGLIGLFLIVSRAISFGWEEIVVAKANEWMSPFFVKASTYAILAFFAVYTLYIIWFALHTTKEKECFVNVSNAENGVTRVSVGALNQLVAHTADSVVGVHDVKTKVYDDSDTVKVRLSMNVDGNVNIPGASMQIKDAIRNRMESVSGIHVRDIDITVGRILPMEGSPVQPTPVFEEASEPVKPAVNVQADSWMPLEETPAQDTQEIELTLETENGENPENEAE